MVSTSIGKDNQRSLDVRLVTHVSRERYLGFDRTSCKNIKKFRLILYRLICDYGSKVTRFIAAIRAYGLGRDKCWLPP